MGKVSENTGKRICIYSDNGAFRLLAIRRAISEEYHGIVRYYGSKWYIETHQWSGRCFVPFRFTGIQYVVSKKKELIEMLSKSVQFTQAYAELIGK